MGPGTEKLSDKQWRLNEEVIKWDAEMKKGEKSEANLREKTRDANNSKEWGKKETEKTRCPKTETSHQGPHPDRKEQLAKRQQSQPAQRQEAQFSPIIEKDESTLIGSITKYLSDTGTHTSHAALVLKYSFGPLNSVVKNFKACCSFRIAGTNTEMRPYVTWGGSVTPLGGIISVSQSRDSRTMRLASFSFTVWPSQGSGASAITSVFMGDAQEPTEQCFF